MGKKYNHFSKVNHITHFFNLTTKMAFIQNPHGRRSAGRPKKSYADDIEVDMKKLKIKTSKTWQLEGSC